VDEDKQEDILYTSTRYILIIWGKFPQSKQKKKYSDHNK